MARPLQAYALLSNLSSDATSSFFLLVAFVAAVASIVISLCTTHKHSKMSKENKDRSPTSPPKEKDRTLLTNTSSEATVVTKMASWKKAGTGSEAEEEALWKKSIIMGERCRPLDFSGQILYDSAGNRLPNLAPVTLQGGGREVLGSVEKA